MESRILCHIASFPGSPALEHEHWSCEDGGELVFLIFFFFFLHMNSVEGREVVERPFLCVGVPKDLELEKERR